jgi:hypothetical protein
MDAEVSNCSGTGFSNGEETVDAPVETGSHRLNSSAKAFGDIAGTLGPCIKA